MDATTWTTKATALRKAGGSAFTLDIIMHCDRADLALLAASGDQRSKRLLRTVHEMDEAIAVRAYRAPILCSTCPKPIHGVRWAAVTAVPEASGDPASALSLAVCADCGPTLKDATAQAHEALKTLCGRLYPQDGQRQSATYCAAHLPRRRNPRWHQMVA